MQGGLRACEPGGAGETDPSSVTHRLLSGETTRETLMAKLDMDEFLQRFTDRAEAVRERGVPPLEGAARKQFIEAAEKDYLDYSLIASASWSLDDGALVLRIPI